MALLLESRLPFAIKGLSELAYNLHWSWNYFSHSLWEQINADVWNKTHNPVQVLLETNQARLVLLAQNTEFVNKLNAVLEAEQAYVRETGWFAQEYAGSPINGVAYFSLEYGVSDTLPLYAGGLGILAGDFLKTASDLAVPLIGIGLFYQQGYFHQEIDEQGWQQEIYLFNDPLALPARPLLNEQGDRIHILMELSSRTIFLNLWQVNLGKVVLYLIDSNDSRNALCDRNITNRLYAGGTELRLQQEIVLGIGGWKLIRLLGLPIDVCHLNEGHAAFATLERIREYCCDNHVNFRQGLWGTRIGNLFTTHTSLPVGFDHYPLTLVEPYIKNIALQLQVEPAVILNLGVDSASAANAGKERMLFSMAHFALRTCAHCNGVSQLHGAMSRQIFRSIFPRWPTREIQIGTITNGVHVPSWDSRWADEVWTNHCGKPRWRSGWNSRLAEQIDLLDDAAIYRLAAQERLDLVNYIRQRVADQTNKFSNTFSKTPCTVLDPNVLTFGWARRFADYKRGDLLLMQPERFARLVTNERFPVQFIVAGRAHPNDQQGKHAIQNWIRFIRQYNLEKKVIFVEDYDIALAQQLVSGVDVWINTPRYPWEACGTSGMKVLVNGGLNISTQDGWWHEAYSPAVGWAIANGDDYAAADALYQLLENDVIPLYYDHNNQGISVGWIKRVRASISQLTTRFCSQRMMKEYIDGYYHCAAESFSNRLKNGAEKARLLNEWEIRLNQHWHELHIDKVSHLQVEGGFQLEAHVYLGGVNADDIAVEAIADPVAGFLAEYFQLTKAEPIENAVNSFHFRVNGVTMRKPEEFTLRIIPLNAEAKIPAECSLIYWQTRTSN